MEVLKTILGGASGAAIFGGFFALLQWWLNRKAKKEDAAAAELKAQEAAQEVDYKELLRRIDVLFLADRTILYDRIKHLGKSHIADGYITVEDLEDLTTMHEVYHDPDKLNGNGFLDNLMKTVKNLPKRVN